MHSKIKTDKKNNVKNMENKIEVNLENWRNVGKINENKY